MDRDDMPQPFEPSINERLAYDAMCKQIDKAGVEELRETCKKLAFANLCVQKAAIRELAKKAVSGEAVRYKFGSE